MSLFEKIGLRPAKDISERSGALEGRFRLTPEKRAKILEHMGRELDELVAQIEESARNKAQEHPLDPFEQQQEEAEERFAHGNVGGLGQWLMDHPHVRKFVNACALSSALAGAAAGGGTLGYLHGKQEYAIEYTIPDKKWQAKETMRVVEGVQGVYWDYAPNMPKGGDLKEEPKIVETAVTIHEGNKMIGPNQLYEGVWTIGGDVPGKIFRFKQGDVWRLKLTNGSDQPFAYHGFSSIGQSTMPHNIDAHAATGPGGGGKDTLIEPGETKVVEMRMTTPGAFQYHCAPAEYGAEMISEHMAAGMSGLVYVEDPNHPLPPVDHEFVIASNEWYGKPNDQKGPRGEMVYELDRDALYAGKPSHVVFNGSVGAVTGEHALKAKVGETMRVFVLNSGPSLPLYLHAIGQPIDIFYPDGGLRNPLHGVGTTTVAPGGTGIMEFRFVTPLTIALVSHNLPLTLTKGLKAEIAVSGQAQPEIYQPITQNPETSVNRTIPHSH